MEFQPRSLVPLQLDPFQAFEIWKSKVNLQVRPVIIIRLDCYRRLTTTTTKTVAKDREKRKV
jgi:hypothetical protein